MRINKNNIKSDNFRIYTYTYMMYAYFNVVSVTYIIAGIHTKNRISLIFNR